MTFDLESFRDEYRTHYKVLRKRPVYLLQAKFHYAILVAGRSEAGRRPAASWNLAYHLAR